MIHYWTLIAFLQLQFLPGFAQAGRQRNEDESLCAVEQTCTSCIETPRCVWCSMIKSSGGNASAPLVRCASRDKFLREGEFWCSRSHVVDEVSSMQFLQNRPLSSKKNREPVQVQPQSLRLRLRIGEEYRVTLRYSQAEDYPVDLYYLMDLSNSMEHYKHNLSELGFHLSEAMKNLTENFRLGFGSFVDKVALPMTSVQPEMLESPCKLKSGKPCAKPYSYQNQMNLTENIEIFQTRVEKAPISGNLDTPEGGLDAMMQVMVCPKVIGWRQKARHLIVFSTDATFHIAGDGKLAGIIEPNDCQCHLDEMGYYTYSLLQDYPSISQINRQARANNMNIIFAVPSNKYATYKMLSNRIHGSSVGTITNDSQNVVKLITSEYEKLASSVTLTDNSPDMIDVRYFSRCLNKTTDPMERRECDGIHFGNVIEFDVIVKVVECPRNRSEWLQTIEIKPSGINESLVIDVELICGCDCDKPEHPENVANSTECKGHGALTCGVCVCNKGFYGRQCECKGGGMETAGASSSSDASMMNECKPSKNSSDLCSGNGICKCGTCECAKRVNPQEVFYGKYCECDNFSCKRSGGKICGGRGKCECDGKCNCLPGWGGDTCDCRMTNSTCINGELNGRAEICSGRGDCTCGVCHCHEISNVRYSGQFCEYCPTCPEDRCEELKDCVECTVYNAGPLMRSNRCTECPHQIDVVNTLEEDPDYDKDKNRENEARTCRMPGNAGCTFVFRYEYHRGGTGGDIKVFRIKVQKERLCSEPVNVLGVALGVVISTVILGLLILLIWKVITTIHDRREFMRFEKERSLARWDRGDNPLYKQATSTFTNPTFNNNT